MGRFDTFWRKCKCIPDTDTSVWRTSQRRIRPDIYHSGFYREISLFIESCGYQIEVWFLRQRRRKLPKNSNRIRANSAQRASFKVRTTSISLFSWSCGRHLLPNDGYWGCIQAEASHHRRNQGTVNVLFQRRTTGASPENIPDCQRHQWTNRLFAFFRYRFTDPGVHSCLCGSWTGTVIRYIRGNTHQTYCRTSGGSL